MSKQTNHGKNTLLPPQQFYYSTMCVALPKAEQQ